MKEKVSKLTALLKKPLPPVICLTGGEEFLKREALQDVLTHRYGPEVPSEDLTTLSGDKNTSNQELTFLFDELRTPSLFGGNRTVVVHRADLYLAADRDAWAEFLKTPWEGALLILILDNLDGRTKVAKALQKDGWVLTADKPFHRPPPWQPHAPPWENDLNTWIVQRAGRGKLELDPPTAHFLQTRVGTNLSDLAQILERLQTVLGLGAKITRDEIEKHTPDGEDSNLFELVDTLFSGDRRKTLRLTRELLHRGSLDARGQRVTDPSALLLQFIGACLSRVRQLRVVHTTQASGGDDAAILRNAGIARPFLPRVKQQAKATGPAALESLVGELRTADRDLKTGAGPLPGELLERIAVRSAASAN